MPGEVPSGEGSVFHFLDIFALGCGLEACSAFFSGKSLGLVFGAVLGAVGFHVLGTKWGQIRGRLGPRLAAVLDRIGRDPAYRAIALVLVLSYFVVSAVLYVVRLRSDLDTYVMPRTLTAQQVSQIRDYLSRHDPIPVVLKYDSRDREAEAFAGKFADALDTTKWALTSDDNESSPPFARECPNLCVSSRGNKEDTEHALAEALRVAGFDDVTSGWSNTAGETKVFLVIGRRPLMLHRGPSLLTRLGQWLEETSK